MNYLFKRLYYCHRVLNLTIHLGKIQIVNVLRLFFCLCYRLSQPPMSSSGATSLPSRRPDPSVSPAMSDTSDSDISLGTHSPVPSSTSLQHSPGSTSGGNDRDDRLQEEREKDYRSFALSSFRFDVHSPGMPGKDDFLIKYFLNGY